MKKLEVILRVAFVLAVIAMAGLAIRNNAPKVMPAMGSLAEEYLPAYSAFTDDGRTGITVWSTATEERFQVGFIFISADTKMTVSLYDGADEVLPIYVGANGGACPTIIPGWKSAARGNDLSFTTSAAGNVTVFVTGIPAWY